MPAPTSSSASTVAKARSTRATRTCPAARSTSARSRTRLEASFTFHFEADFADIRQFFLSIEPPKYPLPINGELAKTGETLFRGNCSQCHGTYGPDGRYPNKVIPLSEIGTDPNRHRGIEEAYGKEYSESWFGKEKAGWFVDGKQLRWTPGYQAPPLDGIWATAPYLHNGSVPTLYHLLGPASDRPRLVLTRRSESDSS